MAWSPVFATSLARSGSYLISMLLSSNKDIMLASEPHLVLFKSLRNAIVKKDAPRELQHVMPPSSPLQDYYFTDERIAVMDCVQAGNLDTPFDPQEWPALLDASRSRTALQCAELVPHLEGLKGATYKEMFDNALNMIADVRKAQDRKWVGIKDAWVLEFFAPLARAYPEAKFLIILRDPRAIINSMLGIVSTDPTQVAHVQSYARHWRKYAALTLHYQKSPLFANRLFMLTHESMLQEPEKKTRELCDFFEVKFSPEMLDTNNYYDFSTGKVWQGNSSFETVTSGISTHRGERWREKLNPAIVKLVDMMCETDMQCMGFKPCYPDAEQNYNEISDYWIRTNSDFCNWRSDFDDPQRDLGFELFRREMLKVATVPTDAKLIRRSFLFEDVYSHLRAAQQKAS